MAFKIYSYPNNYRVWKGLIAAQYCEVDIELPPFTLGVDNKTDTFKAKAPLQKVPVLDTPDGPIWESNAIARYISRLRPDKHLLGHSFYEQGLVDQWVDFSTTELEPARALWLYPILGYMEFNQQAYQAAKKDTTNALSILNMHLLTHTYLVGNQVTLADICICASLVKLYEQVFAPKYISQFPNVTRWFNTCINQPQFASVVGKIVFATKEVQAPKPKKEKGKKGSKKGSKKGKKGSNKDKKKEQPKQAKKEKKKKPQHWSKLLPETTMNLDATKKLFFKQRPINENFFEEFWPIFDDKGYCFYTMEYNYNAENTILFQAQNLLGGYLQRAESCRKFTFGCIMLCAESEEKPPFKACGIWLFRGIDMIPEMKSHVSAEYYTWKKTEDRDLIKKLFMDEVVPNGKVIDRRYFK